MTSSLVGSEMCIRDSRVGAEGESCLAASNPHASPSSFQALQSRSGPVSYTHLTLPTICSV
eukprot:9022827-Prorocentrum_lima.AAC.1